MSTKDEVLLRKLSRKVRARRKALGLTQLEASFKAGFDYSYWQRIEGKNPPAVSIVVLKKLSIALDMTMSELVDGL